MIRRPPRSTLSSSSAASDVYKRQGYNSSNTGYGNTGYGNTGYGNTGYGAGYGNTGYGNSMYGGMNNGNSMYGNSMYGNSMYGNSMYGNSMYGNSMYGGGMGNSMYGNSIYGGMNSMYGGNSMYGNRMGMGGMYGNSMYGGMGMGNGMMGNGMMGNGMMGNGMMGNGMMGNGMMGNDGGSTWMQSIEHVVMAFGKVSFLLQGNHEALHQFFMSVISLVDRFSRLHETVSDFLNNRPADEENLPPIFPGPNGQPCTYGPNGEMIPASPELIQQRDEIMRNRPARGPSIWWLVAFVGLFVALFRWARNRLARRTVMPIAPTQQQQQQQQAAQWTAGGGNPGQPMQQTPGLDPNEYLNS
eukprot:TRINITY_DN3135_c0_g1_i2.p1 TRINITY_DN3135_c0_g1~~TRINITY_DN3135_c0_g1_i2.p1  ORF type:complete len:356 (+),score=96.27 TRINITY_DN3135_c0_g1_i2:122-1189(+)